MIQVDDREQRGGICDALTALHVPFNVQRLVCADYVVGGMVFIERKTVPDFLQSLATRRLFEQVARLCAKRSHSVLIIEGPHLPGRASVRGTLCALAVEWRLPVLRTSTVEDSAWYLARVAARCERMIGTPRVPSICVRPPQMASEQRMLMQIRDVGPALSRALLEHFGGIRSVLSATAQELQNVPGVGEKIAQRIGELA